MIINLIVLDVDGTLTSGGITYGDKDETKTFDVKDGFIIHAMRKMGIKVVFLTGRSSVAVSRRADNLGVTAVQGVSDKSSKLQEILQEHAVLPEKVAYIGDDLNDYVAMRMCGFKACPSDAADEIKAICDYVSTFPGGQGAVRDICEYLLRKIGRHTELLSLYGIAQYPI